MKQIFILSFIFFNFSYSFCQKIVDKVATGDLEYVKKWLDKGKDLDKEYFKVNENKDTTRFDIFTWAANKNQKEILKFLVQNKDKFIDGKIYINKAFGISIQYGDLELIKFLVENGADVNFNCEYCQDANPISIALAHSHADIYYFLRKTGAKLSSESGYAPIHGAATGKNSEILLDLIQNDSLDVNEFSRQGFYPIHYAVQVGNLHNATILMNYGADLDLMTSGDFSILNSAILSKDLKTFIWADSVMKTLDSRFGDEYTEERKNQKRGYLFDAVATENVELMKYIIDNYPIELNYLDEHGRNSLTRMFFVETNKDEIFKLLIENGISFELQDNFGFTFYDYCKKFKNKELLKLIENSKK